MRKLKDQPKYHVVSLRVSDEEKAILEEMSRRDQTNITNVMREAITFYTSVFELWSPVKQRATVD